MSLPVVLVRIGPDVVPVILGSDGTGYDLVREQVIPVDVGHVVGAVNLDPAAVYWGMDLVQERAGLQMAAEGRYSCFPPGLQDAREAGRRRSIDESTIRALVADLREFMGPHSVFGACGDIAYIVYDALRARVPDIMVVYGELAWEGREPIAHWWNDSEQLGLVIDAANPFEQRGYVGPIHDPRYRATRKRKLTRRDLSELSDTYDGLTLDPAYYKSFPDEPTGARESNTQPYSTRKPASPRTPRPRPATPPSRQLRRFVETFLANVEYDGDPGSLSSDDDRIDKILRALADLGIQDVEEILGAGSYGTAVLLDDTHVLKLTTDQSEVQAGHVLTGKHLQHVARVDGSWFIRGVRAMVNVGHDEGSEDDIYKRYPVGVLVLERVQTLDHEQTRNLTEAVTHFKLATHTYPHELAKLSRAKQRIKLRQASIDLEALLKATGYDLRDEDRVEEAYLAEGVAEALAELRDHGVYAIDAHGGNVGYVDEVAGGMVYKLFDIGSSSPPGEPKAKYVDKGAAKKLVEAEVVSGMVAEHAAAEWIGEGHDELEKIDTTAEEAVRAVPKYAPQGIKFSPIESGVFGGEFLTGYTEVRSQLMKHREQVPSIETIALSTTFAGLTVHTQIASAEKAFRCVTDRMRGGRMATLADVDDCLVPLGLIKSRRAMYESAGAWAPLVQEAIKSGLKDRELRRHLYLTTETPHDIALAKLSFVLALLGHDTICLDARLLNRMYDREEANHLAHEFGRPPSERMLARYEAVEDAFLDGNPFYRPKDPIGRARAQWESWQSVGGKPTSHSSWLAVVSGQ